jgi:hypothetical protein
MQVLGAVSVATVAGAATCPAAHTGQLPRPVTCAVLHLGSLALGLLHHARTLVARLGTSLLSRAGHLQAASSSVVSGELGRALSQLW